MDEFPKIDVRGRGRISAWFKLDVVGLYHKGIEVFLEDSRRVIGARNRDGDFGWRFLEDDEESESAIYALAVGRIPFDFIERIDWSRNDGFCNSPHFYCRFDGPLDGPYEDIVYKAKLYPDVSNTLHDLELHRETYKWGYLRRKAYLFYRDAIRYWRGFRAAISNRRAR